MKERSETRTCGNGSERKMSDEEERGDARVGARNLSLRGTRNGRATSYLCAPRRAAGRNDVACRRSLLSLIGVVNRKRRSARGAGRALPPAPPPPTPPLPPVAADAAYENMRDTREPS